MTRIAVVGAGAIGGLLAARLARAGAEVSLFARGATLETLRRDGLRLIERDGTVGEALRLAASDDAAALGVQDYVVLALKAQALPALAPRLAALIGPASWIVSATNGLPWWFLQGLSSAIANQRLDAVDPQGGVSATLPPARAIGCVVHLGASTDSPGVVRHRAGNRLILGAPGGPDTPAQGAAWALRGLLAKGGFDAEHSLRIQHEIWLKLWGNMNMNPISALTGSTMDVLLDDPLMQGLIRRMMEEAAAVGERLGLPVDMSIDARMRVTRELGAFKTSMLQDAEAGRELEIDPILGVFPELGRRLGVPVPFCEAVLGLLRQRAANWAAARRAGA